MAFIEMNAPERSRIGSRPRRRNSAGNALVQWMLVILPAMALVCFMVDVIWALFSWATLQKAVREGCRYTITFQTQTGPMGARLHRSCAKAPQNTDENLPIHA